VLTTEELPNVIEAAQRRHKISIKHCHSDSPPHGRLSVRSRQRSTHLASNSSAEPTFGQAKLDLIASRKWPNVGAARDTRVPLLACTAMVLVPNVAICAHQSASSNSASHRAIILEKSLFLSLQRHSAIGNR
jgi:hypothetical protein